ncbi:MAG: hypothetical protein ABID38_04710 [Candidatus Diapherotrites archaeon]
MDFIAVVKSRINKKHLSIVVCLLFLALLVVLFISLSLDSQIEQMNLENTELNSKFSDLNKLYGLQVNKIINLEEQISRLSEDKRQLESEAESLESEKESLSTEKESLESELQNTLDDIDSTLEEIEAFKQDIQDSMDWFRYNSVFPKKETVMRFKIRSNCFDFRANSCVLITGCLPHINEKDFYFRYKADITEKDFDFKYRGDYDVLDSLVDSTVSDRLISLEEIIKNKGGDCEDFSLFYKAEVNYFLEECFAPGDREIILEAYQDPYSIGPGYYLTKSHDWWIPRVSPVKIKGYKYPNIVCGSLYDFQRDDVAGHCIIAFTKNKIEGIENLHSDLNGAALIEPQTGEFMGYVNGSSEITMIPDTSIHINDSYDDTEHLSLINEVITDGDYFLYDSEREINWISYSSFKETLSEQELELEEIKLEEIQKIEDRE